MTKSHLIRCIFQYFSNVKRNTLVCNLLTLIICFYVKKVVKSTANRNLVPNHVLKTKMLFLLFSRGLVQMLIFKVYFQLHNHKNLHEKNVGAQKPVVQSCPKLILVWEKKESRNIIKSGNGKNGTANIFMVNIGCNIIGFSFSFVDTL